jgi:hypothetical protein
MKESANTKIQEILKEIYQIDDSLRKYEADLPTLIKALETNRPNIIIDKQFTDSLRASLLSYKPATIPTKAPTKNSWLWWTARLAPVGIAVFLFITLIPDPINTTPENYLNDLPKEAVITPSPENSSLNDSSMSKKAFTPEADSTPDVSIESSMMSMIAPVSSLEVAPPLAGTELTIAKVAIPLPGWLVVYADNGGEFGEILSTTYLGQGELLDLTLTLSRELTYPNLITVVVYTGNTKEQFSPSSETIQTDPANNSPMSVTVPVISELELEGVE